MASYQVALLAALSLWLLAGPALAAPSPGPAPSPSWGWWWQRWQTADCPGPGAFPDASDACSPAFRICAYMGPVSGLQPISKSCQPGFVFDAVTGCTFKRECFQKLYPNAAGPWA